MTIIRVGTTKKYSEGWEGVFGKRSGGAKATATAGAKTKKKPAAKKKAKK